MKSRKDIHCTILLIFKTNFSSISFKRTNYDMNVFFNVAKLRKKPSNFFEAIRHFIMKLDSLNYHEEVKTIY